MDNIFCYIMECEARHKNNLSRIRRWGMNKVPTENWKAFLIWCVANLLGFSIPALVLLLVPGLTAISGLLSTTLIISLPLSIAQWIALRRIMPVSALWILSLPASILVFVMLIREIPERFFPDADSEILIVMVIFSIIAGLIIGLPQWLILHREHGKDSIWLLGTVLGIALGAGLVIGTDLVNQSGIAAYIITVLAYTIATGLTLLRLLMHKEQPQQPVINPA